MEKITNKLIKLKNKEKSWRLKKIKEKKATELKTICSITKFKIKKGLYRSNVNLKKGVLTVNYEKIANLVHECVKNPAKLLTEDRQNQSSVKCEELAVVRTVFTRCEVSGGVAAIGPIPNGMWQ